MMVENWSHKQKGRYEHAPIKECLKVRLGSSSPGIDVLDLLRCEFVNLNADRLQF